MEPVKVDQILCCDTCGVELKVIKDCDSSCWSAQKLRLAGGRGT